MLAWASCESAVLQPALIAQTGLLGFISRHHLGRRAGNPGLREVAVKEATMRRRLVATHRQNSDLSPAAARLVALLASTSPAP